MNPDQASLWQRIQAHPLDDSFAACPFSLRLGKENGWGPGFTQRVIEEYRRFAFLAIAAGHPVSPSDAVDQAWHLHLLYTRDYWGEFCPNILRMPLHHGPTRGGASEHEKFTDWYGRTLASYRQFFGEPPADVWPNPAAHPEMVRIDPAQHWVIAKPRWLNWGREPFSTRSAPEAAAATPPSPASSAVHVGSVVGLSFAALLAWPSRAEAATTHPWPFGLPGPEFLGLFILLMAVAIVGAVALRWRLRLPAEPAPKKEMLDGCAAAFLNGGPARAFGAGLVGAAQRNLIEVRAGRVFRTATPVPANLPLIERAICSAAQGVGTELRQVRNYAHDALRTTEAGLVEQGLVLDAATTRKARFLPAGILAAVWVIGAIKYQIGQDLDRPVGILMFLLVVLTVLTLVLLFRRPRRSRRGEQALRHLRTEYSALESGGHPSLRGHEAAWLMPMAVGLFGASVLPATPLSGLETELGSLLERRETSNGGSCGASGGSCGGGDGGGDGGGGGCGGCGGGD